MASHNPASCRTTMVWPRYSILLSSPSTPNAASPVYDERSRKMPAIRRKETARRTQQDRIEQSATNLQIT
jgi:hypothetical protein